MGVRPISTLKENIGSQNAQNHLNIHSKATCFFHMRGDLTLWIYLSCGFWFVLNHLDYVGQVFHSSSFLNSILCTLGSCPPSPYGLLAPPLWALGTPPWALGAAPLRALCAPSLWALGAPPIGFQSPSNGLSAPPLWAFSMSSTASARPQTVAACSLSKYDENFHEWKKKFCSELSQNCFRP